MNVESVQYIVMLEDLSFSHVIISWRDVRIVEDEKENEAGPAWRQWITNAKIEKGGLALTHGSVEHFWIWRDSIHWLRDMHFLSRQQVRGLDVNETFEFRSLQSQLKNSPLLDEAMWR